MRRRAILLFAVATTALLLASGTALAALKIGTDGPDTLVGTNSADQITGGRGNDTLKGLAGNDIYYFDDAWGTDTLDEPRKIGKKPGGSDTLSFSQMDKGVTVRLVRQWGLDFNRAFTGDGANQVSLGLSVVENATGGRGEDIIIGGSDRNTLHPGGGLADYLLDYGGFNDGAGGNPEVPASNDIFKGFGSNTGNVYVTDYGGTADVLDLRPFSSSEVYVNAVDIDGQHGTRESLQIITTSTAQVFVLGHFGGYINPTHQGRMEQLVFSDGAFSGEGQVGSSSAASVSSEEASADTVEKLISDSAERAKTTREGAELKKEAERLLKEAKKEASEDSLSQPSSGEGER